MPPERESIYAESASARNLHAQHVASNAHWHTTSLLRLDRDADVVQCRLESALSDAVKKLSTDKGLRMPDILFAKISTTWRPRCRGVIPTQR